MKTDDPLGIEACHRELGANQNAWDAQWEPIEYTGEACENCHRVRVERTQGGHRVCEKCRWNQDTHEYVTDRPY